MSWFTEHRQQWIADRLQSHGHINSRDLVEKFNTSRALATTDLQRYAREHPGAMTYDGKRKRHIATAARAADDLRGAASNEGLGILERCRDGAPIGNGNLSMVLALIRLRLISGSGTTPAGREFLRKRGKG